MISDEFRIFLERIQPKFYGCDSSVLPTLESIIEEDFTKSSKMFIINNDEEVSILNNLIKLEK